MHYFYRVSILLCLYLSTTLQAHAQKDTLKVMAYNVLYLGNGCAGPLANTVAHFNNVLSFAQPDLLALEKVGSIPTSDTDAFGTAPKGFADSLLRNGLQSIPNKTYAYCPFTNYAQANNICLLYYNTQKLGYAGMVSTYSNITDFNTYKLYIKDPYLSQTKDTTFLYITLNHDKSGDEFELVRFLQIEGNMQCLKDHFHHLGNHLNLGDFNVRTSEERFYKLLTQGKDSAFNFYDPPFFPDRKLKYPANWDHDPVYTPYFTTSTRENPNVPNNCGSGGGGKNWYDHIFISNWIKNNTNYIRYIPNSYRTVGNDGKRFRISIINKNGTPNNAAPDTVLASMFQLSNKYPVMVDLEVTYNKEGKSPIDGEIPHPKTVYMDEITVSNPIEKELNIHFPATMLGQEISIHLYDAANQEVLSQAFTLKQPEKSFKCSVQPGKYILKILGKHNQIASLPVIKL